MIWKYLYHFFLQQTCTPFTHHFNIQWFWNCILWGCITLPYKLISLAYFFLHVFQMFSSLQYLQLSSSKIMKVIYRYAEWFCITIGDLYSCIKKAFAFTSYTPFLLNMLSTSYLKISLTIFMFAWSLDLLSVTNFN